MKQMVGKVYDKALQDGPFGPTFQYAFQEMSGKIALRSIFLPTF